VELHLEKLWDRNITLTTRLVDTMTTPMLLKVVQSGKLQPRKLVTHRFALNDVMKGYDTFGNAAAESALKVILKSESPLATEAENFADFHRVRATELQGK
jgi:alcohol dehydrogenase